MMKVTASAAGLSRSMTLSVPRGPPSRPQRYTAVRDAIIGQFLAPLSGSS